MQRDTFLLLLGPHGTGPYQEVEYYRAFDRHVNDEGFRLVPLISANARAPGLPFLGFPHLFFTYRLPVCKESYMETYSQYGGMSRCRGSLDQNTWRSPV
jgi:hypothetical protein